MISNWKIPLVSLVSNRFSWHTSLSRPFDTHGYYPWVSNGLESRVCQEKRCILHLESVQETGDFFLTVRMCWADNGCIRGVYLAHQRNWPPQWCFNAGKTAETFARHYNNALPILSGSVNLLTLWTSGCIVCLVKQRTVTADLHSKQLLQFAWLWGSGIPANTKNWHNVG